MRGGLTVKQHLIPVVLVLAATMSVCGCAGRVKYPSYYTLNLPPAPDPPAQEGVRFSIAVRDFRAPGYLRQGAIVYRTSPEQIGFYNYQRWASDPCKVVTESVTDHLRASGRYALVKPYDGHADADYVLSGRVEQLEEVDYEGGVQVDVALSAQLVNLKTGETVWTNEVREVGKVERRDVPSVVSEMSRTMDGAIEKLLLQMAAAPSKTN